MINQRIFFGFLWLLPVFSVYGQGNNPVKGTKWVSIHTKLNCTDSLNFYGNNKFYYYDCAKGWPFEGSYYFSGDTIKLEIVTQQLDVNNFQYLEPDAFRTLVKQENKLQMLFIGHKRNGELKEISQEAYEMISDYRRIND